MYKKYGLTLRGLMIEKKMDPEPYLKYVHDVDFDDLKIDNELKNLLKKLKGQNLFIQTHLMIMPRIYFRAMGYLKSLK